MSNERPDEFAGWAGRLEEPGALAGQGLANKEAAWDRLHDRLGSPRRRKKIAGYWLAAACLLLLLIPAALLFRDSGPARGQAAGTAPGQTVIAKEPVASAPAVPAVPRPSHSISPIPAAGSSLPGIPSTPGLQKDLAAAPFVSHHPNIFSGDKSRHRLPRPAARVLADTLSQAPLAVTAPPPPALAASLPIAAIQPAPAKKELTVISINEIANPAGQGPSTTGRHERSGRFRIGFNPGAIRPAMAAQDFQKARFTIKLSSQNP